MPNEIFRPQDFTLPEEVYQFLRLERMKEILNGYHNKDYSEWCLRGETVSSFDDIRLCMAVFPTSFARDPGYILEPEQISLHEEVQNIGWYWRDITTLTIPQFIKCLEREKYKIPMEDGKKRLYFSLSELMCKIMPSAMISFSKIPTEDGQESAYLICPTPIPPSVAFNHILRQANFQKTLQ